MADLQGRTGWSGSTWGPEKRYRGGRARALPKHVIGGGGPSRRLPHELTNLLQQQLASRVPPRPVRDSQTPPVADPVSRLWRRVADLP